MCPRRHHTHDGHIIIPAAAIVAGHRRGYQERRAGDADVGSVGHGRNRQIADLVLLGADPLTDIHNIRKLVAVFKDGRPVDFGVLPTKPVFYRPVAKPVP